MGVITNRRLVENSDTTVDKLYRCFIWVLMWIGGCYPQKKAVITFFFATYAHNPQKTYELSTIFTHKSNSFIASFRKSYTHPCITLWITFFTVFHAFHNFQDLNLDLHSCPIQLGFLFDKQSFLQLQSSPHCPCIAIMVELISGSTLL